MWRVLLPVVVGLAVIFAAAGFYSDGRTDGQECVRRAPVIGQGPPGACLEWAPASAEGPLGEEAARWWYFAAGAVLLMGLAFTPLALGGRRAHAAP